MISKQYIKDLEFEEIEDIFNYIVESEINGNFTQCKEIINKLSIDQFKQFIEWLQLDYLHIQQFIQWRDKNF
jgi:hypothetical protein